jgi:hypothetical protein
MANLTGSDHVLWLNFSIPSAMKYVGQGFFTIGNRSVTAVISVTGPCGNQPGQTGGI